ncbi:hypothetical protein LP420_40995 [Massilia sp. B-10]|nr:hypothetical protein LP420_40995 [Massilia sp. B-10]
MLRSVEQARQRGRTQMPLRHHPLFAAPAVLERQIAQGRHRVDHFVGTLVLVQLQTHPFRRGIQDGADDRHHQGEEQADQLEAGGDFHGALSG